VKGDFTAFLERRGRLFNTAAGFLLVAIVGVLDYATGYELGFSLFYLIPIALLAWFAGWRLGIASSVMSAAVWLSADLGAGHPYSHFIVPYWNTVIRLGIFIVITLLLVRLKKALEHERILSRVDFLTGAFNARHFMEILQSELERSKRYGGRFTIAYIDLDNFKTVNDNFGHNTGDRVLRAVVEEIRSNLRKTDTVARLGGDEFALLFPETGPRAARSTVNKIREKLARATRKNGWTVTLSIGVLTCAGCRLEADELLKKADNLMYASKREGKNSVSFFDIKE
jgi:diguanylate cyclase (GGDEF)-like protein